MLNVLKNLQSEQLAKSELLSENFGYEALVAALMSKDMEGVNNALTKLKKATSPDQEKFLVDQLIESDWPNGYDKVVEHLGVSRKLIEHYDGETSLLAVFVSESAWSLALREWKNASADERKYCVDNYLSLGLAEIILQVEEGERLKELAATEAGWDDMRILMSTGLGVLHENLVSYQKQENKAAPIGEGNWNFDAITKMIGVLLEGGGPKLAKLFWEGVCKKDDVGLVKHLATNGVIGQNTICVQEKPIDFLGTQSAQGIDRIPKRWLDKWDSSKSDWRSAAHEVHAFNLAEIICLLSAKEFKILSHCILDKEFRDALLSSPVAKHALVSMVDRDVWGVGLCAELKGQGVDMSQLVGDTGQTPLHVASIYYRGRASEAISLRELVKIHPEWVDIEDKIGRPPLLCVEENYRGEVSAIFEEAQIKKLLSKGRKEQDKKADKKLRV